MADERITLAHGAGGKMSQQLMQEVILPEFANPYLNDLHDGASVTMSGRVAFTTDSYVVQPLFFNGGNIGKLAVCGTDNDLSMTGAVPRYISVGMILEEGFLIEDLRKIAHTMREMADEAGIAIVTGDTKVVERGKADGIFINTAGIGDIIPGTSISPHHVKPGMKVLLSGFIGDHAATVLAGRHGLELPDTIKTDCAPLNSLTRAMLEAAPDIAVLRDPTRGGLASTLNEPSSTRSRRPRTAASSSTRTPCPSARKSAASATSWASTRSTSPMRASASPSCRLKKPTRCSPSCARTRTARTPA